MVMLRVHAVAGVAFLAKLGTLLELQPLGVIHARLGRDEAARLALLRHGAGAAGDLRQAVQRQGGPHHGVFSPRAVLALPAALLVVVLLVSIIVCGQRQAGRGKREG